MLNIGQAIRMVRQAKGMKLSTLSEAAGVSSSFLSLVESGDRQPSLAVVRQVASALGIPSEVLIVLSQPSNGTLQADATSNRLADSIRKLMEAEGALKEKLRSETADGSNRSDTRENR